MQWPKSQVFRIAENPSESPAPTTRPKVIFTGRGYSQTYI